MTISYRLALLKPSVLVVENEGAAYEPTDTASLADSLETIHGWIQPPVGFIDPSDSKPHIIDGGHRIVVLRKKGWMDTPIPVLLADIPEKVARDRSGKALEEWRLLLRIHANTKRRRVPPSEWRVVFEKLQTDLGWSQEQIGRYAGMDRADVSRILSGTTPADKQRAYRERKSVERSTPEPASPSQSAPVSEGTPVNPEPASVPPAEPAVTGEAPMESGVGGGDIAEAKAAASETSEGVQVPPLSAPSEPEMPRESEKSIRNRYLQAAFDKVEAGDPEVADSLNWEQWHIRRKLKAVGVPLFSEDNENPGA